LASRWSLALALVLAASSARAEPSASERETARALVRSGRTKRTSGDLKGAIADMRAAHTIMGIPPTGLELGRTLAQAGQLVEAHDTLVEVTHMATTPRDPPTYAKAQKDAKALADALAPRLATIKLSVVAPAGVKPNVTIDNDKVTVESLPAPLKVNPGVHLLRAQNGDEVQEARVELSEGGEREVSLTLSQPVTTAVEPAPPERDAPPAPTPPSTRTSPLVYAGFITAGVGVAIGATTGLLAFSRYSSVSGQCDAQNRCGPETHSDISAGRTFGTISTIAFIVAGVGAAVGAIGLLTPVRAEKRAAWLTGDGVAGTF
jgi:hypothetical protein